MLENAHICIKKGFASECFSILWEIKRRFTQNWNNFKCKKNFHADLSTLWHPKHVFLDFSQYHHRFSIKHNVNSSTYIANIHTYPYHVIWCVYLYILMIFVDVISHLLAATSFWMIILDQKIMKKHVFQLKD